MWADNETDQDLLGFSIHAELLRSIITDPEMLPVTVGLFGEAIGKITVKEPSITRRRVTRFVASRQYDSSKLEKIVGFKPEYDLQKTLEDAY